MADLVVQYPIDFTSITGDRTNSGVLKHKNEIAAMYGHINDIRENYSGTVAPANPNKGQSWRDTNTTPSLLKRWNGSTWAVELNEAVGAAIASASTINLTSATGRLLHITGTTAITAVTLQAGVWIEVIFDGILTLTHHATNNNLPSAANITTAAGDRATYYSDGTTVYCTKYERADGSITAKATSSVLGGVKVGEGIAVDTDGVISSKITILNETQPSGTAGGTFTSGAWRQRALNTAVIDQIGVSLSSNQFTLPAGTYEVFAQVPAYTANAHKARLQNLTDGTTTLLGQNAYGASSVSLISTSNILGSFTIAASKTFEIGHQCSLTANTNGFGYPVSIAAVNEVYTQILIRKVA